jgi:hypothetical protein
MGMRKTGDELETVGFDAYFFIKDATEKDGIIGGRIICRNTDEDLRMNDFALESGRIRPFLREQIVKSIAKNAMKKLIKLEHEQ